MVPPSVQLVRQPSRPFTVPMALSESGRFPADAIRVPYDDVPKHLVSDIKDRPHGSRYGDWVEIGETRITVQ